VDDCDAIVKMKLIFCKIRMNKTLILCMRRKNSRNVYGFVKVTKCKALGRATAGAGREENLTISIFYETFGFVNWTFLRTAVS
jgi:hypothetical protein